MSIDENTDHNAPEGSQSDNISQGCDRTTASIDEDMTEVYWGFALLAIAICYAFYQVVQRIT